MVNVSEVVQQQYVQCIIHARGVHDTAAYSISLSLALTHVGRYMTARLLSDKDLQLIRNFDKRPADTQDSLLKEVSRKLGFAKLISARTTWPAPVQHLCGVAVAGWPRVCGHTADGAAQRHQRGDRAVCARAAG